MIKYHTGFKYDDMAKKFSKSIFDSNKNILRFKEAKEFDVRSFDKIFDKLLWTINNLSVNN